MREAVLTLVLALAMIASGCGDDSQPVSRQRGFATPPPRPTAPAVGGQAAPAPSGGPSLAGTPHVALTDQDFVESEDNRDPFRAFAAPPAAVAARPKVSTGEPVAAEKFALEELRLIAIISGTTNPRAMFRDPNGIGNIVHQGELVSRSEAKIKQILSDRVVFELQDETGGPEPRKVERVVMLRATVEEELRRSQVRVLSKSE